MPSRTSDFHEGEAAVQAMLKVPAMYGNPTSPGLPMQSGARVSHSPIVALGTLDKQGRPWTTIWGGERGFAQPVAQNVLGFNSGVDTAFDPVFEAFWDDAEPNSDGVVRLDKVMSALAIDLVTRDRMKLMGRMIGGAKTPEGDVQMAMVVTESLGNCPKYLNKREITPHAMQPELLSEHLPLSTEALRLIDRADMFFLSTTNGETMDTNHRGGPPGFVRVVQNDEHGVVLAYPEYSGNRLYQSLGNLKLNPLIGIAFPDYETSDVLYITGSASILVGKEASTLLTRTNLALQITVTSCRLVKSGLPFRGSAVEYSPYNPPPRFLNAEHDSHMAAQAGRSNYTASFVRRELLSPTIARFTMKLSSRRGSQAPTWLAGQYVTLDFDEELDTGYAHMNDADPQSLNDDFVRTFTVSSAPQQLEADELQITVRRHGPATDLLWKHNPRVPLELPVLGFGGEASFQMPTKTSSDSKLPVFVAAGVGATPLLAQAKGVLGGGVDLQVLWSIREEDLPLVMDSFERIPGLAAVTKLFITGSEGGHGADVIDQMKEKPAVVERRRIGAEDFKRFKGQNVKFFVCTAPALRSRLNTWLEGEEVASEDFGY